jgi:plastocyanin
MSHVPTHKWLRPVTLVGLLLLAACDAGPTEPVASQITIYGGDNQVAPVDSMLPTLLAVRVTDSGGRAVPEVTIRWIVEEGGGSIIAATTSSVTNDWGVASAVYRLGPEEGIQRVTAAVDDSPGAPRVTFTARAVTALVFVAESQDDLYACFYYGLNCSASFSPSEVTVPAGKTVAWLWEGSRRCDVVFEDDPTEPASSPSQEWGRHFRTFTTPGTFRYRCTLHSTSFTEGMVGTVTVQ